MGNNKRRKVLVVGDMHLPFADRSVMSQIYSAIEQHNPQIVVQIGDLFDMFAMSRFYRTHNLMTPKEEVEKGRLQAEAFWGLIGSYRVNRQKIKCFQLMGNHDVRPFKRVLEKMPELESVLASSLHELFAFKGVETLRSDREELDIDGVRYIHGYMSKLGDHARYFLQPTVCGHSHRGGTHFFTNNGKPIWELNVGYVADNSQVPLQYNQTKTTRWTHGYGLVDEAGPRFVPILSAVDKHKRRR